MIKISVPLKVPVSKKKYFILNMNNYRNAHHRVLSAAKRNFTDYVLSLPMRVTEQSMIQVHYKIYPASKRKYDTMNVISVVDKFLMDALIKKGIIVDDNYNVVKFPTAECCPPDRDNPRIEVEIKTPST